MTRDLNFPTRIITAGTVREADGLAMSSRNAYLSDEERKTAPLLYGTLVSIQEEIETGQTNFDELEAEAVESLDDAGFGVEYVAIRRAEDLAPPTRDSDELVVLAAASLGNARLIDNVVVTV